MIAICPVCHVEYLQKWGGNGWTNTCSRRCGYIHRNGFTPEMTFEDQRAAGLLICRCPRPLPDGIGECGQCHKLVRS